MLFQSHNAAIIDNTQFIKGRGAQSNPVNPFTNEIKETQEIEEMPDPDDAYFEAELWKVLIAETEKDKDQYIKVEKMSSREAFQVVADFTEEVTDEDIRNRLVYALNRNRPFQNFKYEVGFKEEVRQLWFTFKKQKYQEWVKEYLEHYIDEEE